MSVAISLLAVAFPALEAYEGLNFPVDQDVVFEIAFLVEDFVTKHVSAQQHLPHAFCFLAQNLNTGVVAVLLDGLDVALLQFNLQGRDDFIDVLEPLSRGILRQFVFFT